MAIQSTPVVPASASAITLAGWGIDNTLSGFIIQNEDIVHEAITDQTNDQKNRVIGELDYDEHWALSFQVIGNQDISNALSVGQENFVYDGAKWKVKSIDYAGAYNDKKKWSVTAERWANYPEQ